MRILLIGHLAVYCIRSAAGPRESDYGVKESHLPEARNTTKRESIYGSRRRWTKAPMRFVGKLGWRSAYYMATRNKRHA